MFKKIIASCKKCGDETTFAVARSVERGGITRFVYICESCGIETVESVVALPEVEPKIYDTVLFEVI